MLALYVLAGALPLENCAFLMQDVLEANLPSTAAGAALSLHHFSIKDAPEVVVAQAMPVHRDTSFK